jgi:hypothetical protein
MPTLSSLTSEKIGNWKLITTAFRPHLEKLAPFAGQHSGLENLTVEAESLQVRQKALRAELQDLNRRRAEVAKTGEELRTRLAAVLQAELGFTSEKLIEFGVKPRRPRVRSRKAAEPQPAQAQQPGTPSQ